MLGKPRRIVLKATVSKSRDRAIPEGTAARPADAAGGVVAKAVLSLEKHIKDPTQGLPESVFRLVSSLVPMVNVDLLIRNEKGETLLTWRDDDFYPRGWHIPGGIIRFKESLTTRIRKVAMNELGVRVRFDPLPLAVSEVVTTRQRIRGHFISFLYRCSLLSALPARLRFTNGVPKAGAWAWFPGCPKNILDCQRRIYGDFLKGAGGRA